MAYTTVPNTFVESATAYASAVNGNFSAVLAGMSDGSKDLNVNDIALAGSFTPAGQIVVKSIMPAAGTTYDLASAAGKWNNIYVNSLSVSASAVVGTLNCTNTGIVNGNLQILTAASLNVYATANFQHILPQTNNTFDIGGGNTTRFNDVWVYTLNPIAISFCSGVGLRRSTSSNYLYLDGTQISLVGKGWVQDEITMEKSAVINSDLTVVSAASVGTLVAGNYNTWVDGSASATLTGWAGGATVYFSYSKVGKQVVAHFQAAGTSNATTATMQLPNAVPAVISAGQFYPQAACYAQDAGAALSYPIQAVVGAVDSMTVEFNKKYDATGGWTNSGTKTIQGVLVYQCE